MSDTSPTDNTTSRTQRTYRCPKCNAIVTKVPISNYTDEHGETHHIPAFGFAICDACGWKSSPMGGGLIIEPPTPAEHTG